MRNSEPIVNRGRIATTQRASRLARSASVAVSAERPAISECRCATVADPGLHGVPVPERNRGFGVSGRGDGCGRPEGAAGLAAGECRGPDEAASRVVVFVRISRRTARARYLVGIRSGSRIRRSLAYLATHQNGGLVLIGAFLTTGAFVPFWVAVWPLVTVIAFHFPLTGLRMTEPLSTWTVVVPLR